MAKELNVPINYFFCETEDSVILACLIDKLDGEGKCRFIMLLEERVTN